LQALEKPEKATTKASAMALPAVEKHPFNYLSRAWV